MTKFWFAMASRERPINKIAMASNERPINKIWIKTTIYWHMIDMEHFAKPLNDFMKNHVKSRWIIFQSGVNQIHGGEGIKEMTF